MPSTVQSLANLLEATLAVPGQKNLTGNIEDIQSVFRPEVFINLEREYPGIFAFLVFHPKLDPGFKDYVSLEGVGAEAGKDILVLFTLETRIHTPKKMTPALLQAGITIQSDEHPAYEFARSLFAPRQPLLPGVVFFRRLSGLSEPVYVHVADASSTEVVGTNFRRLFLLVNESYSASKTSGMEFSDLLAKRLALADLKYERIQSLSVLEVLARSFHTVKRNLKDIAAVVDLFK